MMPEMEGRFATEFAALLEEGRTIYESQREMQTGFSLEFGSKGVLTRIY